MPSVSHGHRNMDPVDKDEDFETTEINGSFLSVVFTARRRVILRLRGTQGLSTQSECVGWSYLSS